MQTLPVNPITTEKLQAQLDEIRSLDYSNFHSRWQRAYSDYEHAIRVLLAFMEADEANSGEVEAA